MRLSMTCTRSPRNRCRKPMPGGQNRAPWPPTDLTPQSHGQPRVRRPEANAQLPSPSPLLQPAAQPAPANLAAPQRNPSSPPSYKRDPRTPLQPHNTPLPPLDHRSMRPSALAQVRRNNIPDLRTVRPKLRRELAVDWSHAGARRGAGCVLHTDRKSVV